MSSDENLDEKIAQLKLEIVYLKKNDPDWKTKEYPELIAKITELKKVLAAQNHGSKNSI